MLLLNLVTALLIFAAKAFSLAIDPAYAPALSPLATSAATNIVKRRTSCGWVMYSSHSDKLPAFHDGEIGDCRVFSMTPIESIRIEYECVCFFYEEPCFPDKGVAVAWFGWKGWQDRQLEARYKGYHCRESRVELESQV